MPEEIDHPPHYNDHPSGVECITVVEHMTFNVGNAVKYLWRAGKKNPDALTDLKKARWYIDRELARVERGQDHDELEATRRGEDGANPISGIQTPCSNSVVPHPRHVYREARYIPMPSRSEAQDKLHQRELRKEDWREAGTAFTDEGEGRVYKAGVRNMEEGDD